MSDTKFPHIFALNIDDLEAVKVDERHIWGYEKWLVNDKDLDLGCKMLIIFPGFRSSKHNHDTKSEYFQVLSGELRLTTFWETATGEQVGDRIIDMKAGQKHFIPAGQYHHFETGTKQFVLLLEVSTYEDEMTNKAESSRKLY